MGIYVNPGNTAFQKALRSEIYIDKTELITVTNSRIDTGNCYMCVSRHGVSESLWPPICLPLITAKDAAQTACSPDLR